MRIGSLFSGYGGLDMAIEEFFDAETVWVSDIDPGACKILAHRTLAPNIGDITAVDWSQVEPVDILTGGFPCQDLSHAGKRAGMHDGTRSGLWSHMAAAIEQLRPRYVVAENVRGLLSASATSDLEPCPWCLGGSADGEPALRALGCVLGDLAELGYDTQWTGLRAADVGAPHGRFRVFILATDTQHSELQGVRALSRLGIGHDSRPDVRLSASATADPASARDGGVTREFRGAAAADGGSWPSEGRFRDASQRGCPAPHASSERHGRGEDGRSLGRLDGDAAASAVESASARTPWGPYEPAIRRWERRLGRPAPAPTETSTRGSQRLSPRFVEWMMGLPAGWVTDVPGLGRNAQLKALGNGVVPQQAYAALAQMHDAAVAA